MLIDKIRRLVATGDNVGAEPLYRDLMASGQFLSRREKGELFDACYVLDDYARLEEFAEAACEIQSDNLSVCLRVGNRLKDAGMIEQAVQWLGRIKNRSYGIDASTIAVAQYGWDIANKTTKTLVARYITRARSYQHAKLGKLCKVGLLSPDFRAHVLQNLMLEPLRELSKRIDCSFYMTGEERNDYAAEQYRSFGAYKSLHGKSADECAAIIFSDKIDVLIDLGGYTASGRVDVLVRKPAPVQAGWIAGMMTPLYAPEVDFFFCSEDCIPPSAASDQTIIPMKVGHGAIQLETLELAERVPGKLTVGLLGNTCKYSDEYLSTVAAIAKAGKVDVVAKGTSPAASARLLRALSSAGAADTHTKFIPQVGHLAAYRRAIMETVDISLDTFPCGGCQTTAESLEMGLPVVTLAVDSFLGRQSASILYKTGHGDWVANSQRQYVDIALRLLSQLPTRTAVRDSIMKSPLRDSQLVAEELLSCIHRAWTLKKGLL